MFEYNKMLEFPVKIKNKNSRLANIVATQYGGPDCKCLSIRQWRVFFDILELSQKRVCRDITPTNPQSCIQELLKEQEGLLMQLCLYSLLLVRTVAEFLNLLLISRQVFFESIRYFYEVPAIWLLLFFSQLWS